MSRTRSNSELTQRLPTFSEVQAEFGEDATSIRRCFANPYGKRCEQTLDSNRQIKASMLIIKDAASLAAHELRAIITLLICEQCQKVYNYRYTKSMAEKWSSEFNNIDMKNIDWLSDPDTYARSGTPTHTPRRRSSNTGSATRGRLSPGGTMQEEIVISSRSPTPATRHARQEVTLSSAHDATRPTFELRITNEQHSLHPQVHREEYGGDPFRDDEALEPILRTTDAVVQDEPMPDRPTRAGSRRASRTELFSPGDASLWTPEMIVDDVENLLTSEIPAGNRGAIYAFKQTDGPHVKIGYTTQSEAKRRTQIKKESNVKLDVTPSVFLANIEMRLLLRLEKLVHADLAYAQRKLKVTTLDKRSTQHEWFDVKLETARQSIEFWLEVVKNQSRVVELETTASRKFLEYEGEAARQAVNADHDRRLKYWRERVIIPKKHTVRSVLHWLTGCAAIALIPVFLNIPERFAQALVVLGISIWTKGSFSPAYRWWE